MNLKDYITARGWVRNGSNKCLCPFHNDRSASAILNPNSIYCFTCGTLFTLWDFQQAFGVFLDKVNEDESGCLSAIKGEPSYQPNQVLFSYPFVVK